jgi:hypothetical protein
MLRARIVQDLSGKAPPKSSSQDLANFAIYVAIPDYLRSLVSQAL